MNTKRAYCDGEEPHGPVNCDEDAGNDKAETEELAKESHDFNI